MTIGIYIRVSTQEQAKEGYSIPAQKERLIAYCTALGWTDYKFYIDEGVSAKDLNRPELQKMLGDVKKKLISTVLVYRLDRLTRRVKDLYTLLDDFKNNSCTFRSATEPYDTSSAMGKMFIGLVALLAQWEAENLSERVKMALEEKVSGGERVGAIPYGFDLDEKEKLVANEKAEIVLDMVDKVKSGMTANRLAEFLNVTNGERNWRANSVLRVLRNPALYGATKWNDKIYEGTHTGIITKKEFEKLQLVLDDRAAHHNRDVENEYLFQGVLNCPTCGHILSVNRYLRKRKDGSEYQGSIYKCQECWREGRKMISVGEQRFTDALLEYMKHVEFKNIPQPNPVDDKKAVLEKQLEQIERIRANYQRAWAAGKMMDKEFDSLMDETLEPYESVKSQLNGLKDNDPIDVEALKEIVFTFNQTFSYLTRDEKKSFIARFIRRIHFVVTPTKPKNYRNKKGKGLVVITDVEFY
ncbi:recombinase family protein [Bacillus marasmi]|uniref:recombinase family protein n=1 Tax=Bacillus marasmi TaxID=1926279 RepID=UPI00164D231E|nr:recombinase family protein [Bacillus marasmi]